MYQISDSILFNLKVSIIIDFREWDRILNEFQKTTIQQAQKMSSVENQAAGQLVASLDSVHAVRYSSSHCNCQLLAMELWTNQHSSTLMKEMYPDMSDMTSIVQIPSCKGFSWEKWLMNR